MGKKSRQHKGAAPGNRVPAYEDGKASRVALPGPGAAPKEGWLQRFPYLLPLMIVAVCGAACSPCLENNVNLWDDGGYLLNDVFIKNLSWQGIGQIFRYPVMGNYHPLTILTYAVEYHFVGLEPFLYHLDSLLLHLAVTGLAYVFVYRLSGKPMVAAVCALLMGLHPMHMESVAWVSGRKDVLYTLFYLGACIVYADYVRKAQPWQSWRYIMVIFLFLLSLLSKGLAVTLPITLLLIDYFMGREFRLGVYIEKIPHFLLSLAFGVQSVVVQRAAGALAMHKIKYNLLERFVLGFYALGTYLWKLVLPLGLHCLYPYPVRTGAVFPWMIYLYPAVIVTGIILAFRFVKPGRVLVFGILFFTANIMLLLQFIPVGESIIAERYSYLSYLGLFFVAGFGMDELVHKGGAIVRRVLPRVGLVYVGLLAYGAYERCSVWHDEMSLWRDEIEKEPTQAPQAYNNLGYLYYQKWTGEPDPAARKVYYDSSVYLLERAIALQPDYVNPYVALGELQRTAGNYDEAYRIFGKAIALHPEEGNLYLEMAILFYVRQDKDSAGFYFRREMAADHTASAVGNYGNYLEWVGKDDSALVYYNKALGMDPTNHILFANRGKLYKKMKKWDLAEADFEQTLRMDPENGEMYYMRSFCDSAYGKRQDAVADVEKALVLGYRHVDSAYYAGLRR